MRSKLKWGPTIQQNNNVIYVVNLGAEAETIYTQALQSIGTKSIPQEGGGGDRGHLPNKGCAASAKSRPGKNYKISVQMILSIRIDNIFLLTGLCIYTGEYKAQGPTLCPTEGRALRGPRALYSPV